MTPEEQALQDALKNAVPSVLKVPNRFADGIADRDKVTVGQFPVAPSGFEHSQYQAPFPTPEGGAAVTQEVAADDAHYSFQMENATDNEGYKVLIHDGQVNGVTPPGMGNDDFILTVGPLNTPAEYSVWIEVTYDTSTLAPTSYNINSGNDIPTSTFGDAFFLLGFVTVESAGPTTFKLAIQNTQCGDINIAFMYGALNGQPALFLLSQLDDPQPLPP